MAGAFFIGEGLDLGEMSFDHRVARHGLGNNRYQSRGVVVRSRAGNRARTGLHALWWYVGANIPIRPAATRLSAATLRTSCIANEPLGTARTPSRTRSAAEVILRPSGVRGEPPG